MPQHKDFKVDLKAALTSERLEIYFKFKELLCGSGAGLGGANESNKDSPDKILVSLLTNRPYLQQFKSNSFYIFVSLLNSSADDGIFFPLEITATE